MPVQIDLDKRTVLADGTVVCQGDAMLDLLYSNKDLLGVVCQDRSDQEEWELANKICDTQLPGPVYYNQILQEPVNWRQHWLTPDDYTSIDIKEWCLTKCSDDQQRTRVLEEIAEFEYRNMLPIMQHLLYCVDHWRSHGIFWGVGRGSSVCSFVLYLIGINRINPLEYDLDISEWLK
jgi:hypothetical protein